MRYLVDEALAAASANGLRLFPPRAWVRSNVNLSLSLCSFKFADWESLLRGDPLLTDHIQEALFEVKSMLPPDHEPQLEPRKNDDS